MGKFTNNSNLFFVSGDILSEKTWDEVNKHVDRNKPVLIFSEGVVAQYFNSGQKKNIANFARELLMTEGSCFVVDDTLRNHPELHSNVIIKEGIDRVVDQSGRADYKNDLSTYSHELNNWHNLFNNTTYTIDYILSKPEMDFAIKSFKLIVCANDPKNELEQIFLKQSEQNCKERIWK
jgi:hypothetical protein